MNYFESKLFKLWQFFFCRRLYGSRNALLMTLRAGSNQKNRTLLFKTPDRQVRPFTFRGKRDMGVISHFWVLGVYIEDTPEAPIRTILDCGANIGAETMRFRMHHPAAQIVSVEADPDNAAVLKQNFSPDPLTTVVEGAVWFENSTLNIRRDPHGSPEGSSVTAEPSGDTRIPAFSIPHLMALRKWKTIDILKLDVEGAEYELFQHDTAWLAQVNAVIFEVPDFDRPGTLQLMFEKFRDSEWNGSACGENLVLIRKHLPWKSLRVLGVQPRH
jgi:FkbM family methyltransferase